MRRLFFGFPRGWPGMTLLLVRAVFGLTLLIEGGYYVGAPNPTMAAWILGLSDFGAGSLLLIGLFTPVVAGLVAAGALAVGLSLLPACMPTLFDSKVSLIFGLTMLMTIIGLGPGAFSVDARVFGRREIIIPPRTPRSLS
jgi:uncharacterized membrane protein YphA (DoxX/SURF4 family)